MLPREKLHAHGAQWLSDAELLSIFLRTGVKGLNVQALSDHLLHRFGGLRGLVGAGVDGLTEVHGVGPVKASQLIAALEITRRYLTEALKKGQVISDPATTRLYVMSQLRAYEQEVFSCLFLDSQHRLICYEELFFGTIDGASVHPREVLKRALAHNAAAVIFAHNHPSGVAEPSEADRRITERLQSALSLVDIRVLDHLVVGDTAVVSFAETGLL